jgi:hypothetical protein
MKKILFILAISLAIGTSCSKKIYVPGPERIKTEYKDRFVRDSIFVSDSILIDRTGDTILIQKYRYIYRDRWQHDSIMVSDSVRVPVPYEDTDRLDKFKKYLKNRLTTNGILFIILILFIIWHYIRKKL